MCVLRVSRLHTFVLSLNLISEQLYCIVLLPFAFSTCRKQLIPQNLLKSPGFQQNGTITIDGIATPLEYEYDRLQHNSNLRTIQQFSTRAKELMYDCPPCFRHSAVCWTSQQTMPS